MNAVPGKLSAGVVGLGIGEQHARAYLAHDSCSLRWLYDLDATRAQKLVRELGAGEAAGGFEEILQDRETQVVSIASYDDAHRDQVVAALDAGKHVFVEKPLCRSESELRDIRQAWEKN